MNSLIKRIVILLSLPLALAGAVLFAATVDRGETAGQLAPVPVLTLSSGHVSLLERPRAADDVLPDRVLAGPLLSEVVDPADARLALAKNELRAWVVPGTRDRLCLIVADSSEGSMYASCAARSLLHTKTIFLSRPRTNGSLDVVGIVGDGVDRVSAGGIATPVNSNSFVLRGISGQVIALEGGGGRNDVDLGQQQPPGG